MLRATLILNGILQPNQETLVQVTPRFPGVAREVHKRIGDRIQKGDLLARIESNQSLTAYDLRAPLSGTIIDRQVALGEHVGEQKPIFTIADLSTVWVDFSVYRRDLKRVRIGDTVLIDAEEDGGEPIETKISYMAPVGNSDTQSALARAVISNADMRLRPGLFVTGRLLLSERPVDLAVKSSALQTLENRTVVFVRNGTKFDPRDVEVGERDTDFTEITFGLVEGDTYAAKNSFVIKAEIAKGTASHDHWRGHDDPHHADKAAYGGSSRSRAARSARLPGFLHHGRSVARDVEEEREGRTRRTNSTSLIITSCNCNCFAAQALPTKFATPSPPQPGPDGKAMV